jgi:hypothetical protein
MKTLLAVLMVMAVGMAPAQAPSEKQSQIGYCPRTAELNAAQQEKYWFEGMLGKKHVRMYLNRGGGGVVGVYYDTADWVPVFLGGKWISGEPAGVELTALSGRDRTVGILKAKITANGLAGSWTGAQAEAEEFQLRSETQPKCDGSEKWKSFSDGRWPITFSYPGTWHASVNGDSMTLTCPDASSMAYDGWEISVRQGGDAENETTDFVQCQDKWIYGYGCKCGANLDGCKNAVLSERGGITELRANQIDWKMYCRDGGYVGSGTGDRRVLTFGDTWIVVEAEGQPAELVERLVETVKRRK